MTHFLKKSLTHLSRSHKLEDTEGRRAVEVTAQHNRKLYVGPRPLGFGIDLLELLQADTDLRQIQ